MRLPALALGILLASLPAQAQVTSCDRLAAHPDDPDKTGSGVSQNELDAARAIAACDSDLRADPKNPRLAYQLGRALFSAGQSETARRQFAASAAAGYRQAQFMLGFLALNIDRQPCAAGEHWRKAAQGGHLWAEFSFASSALAGTFAGCGWQVPAEEIRGYLASARGKAKGTRIETEVEGLAKAFGLP